MAAGAQPALLARRVRGPLPLGRWRALQPVPVPELRRALHGGRLAPRHRAAALACWTG